MAIRNLGSIVSTLHKFASPVIARLKSRFFWWQFGNFPIRSNHVIKRLLVDGMVSDLVFPHGESHSQQWELKHILQDDPYRLNSIQIPVGRVVDVGANIGIFTLFARHKFPGAVIHSYEPNLKLTEVLQCNTRNANAVVFAEGVSRVDGTGSICNDDNSLCGIINTETGGSIPIRAFATVLERIGGSIDLLKLDCEGGEWEILRDRQSLSKVRFLVMEYHLDCPSPREPQKLSSLVSALNDHGFRITSLRESDNTSVGQLSAENLKFSGF